MKRFKGIIIWGSLHLLLFGIYVVSRSNVRRVDAADCAKVNVAALAKLSQLVEQNFLNRSYYEVFSQTEKWPCLIVNYNTEHHVLLISTDPGSGWSYFLEATPEQLKMIAEKRYTIEQTIQLLRAVPADKRRNYPDG